MKSLLRDIAVITAGQGAPQGESNYCDNGTPFVKAGNLLELIEGKDIKEIQNVSEEVARSHKLKLYPKGTILFAKSGMSCLKGYVYVLPQNAYVVSHLACITPKEEISNYLKYYFTLHRPNRLIKDSSYPSISLNDIGELKIDIKSPSEREKIVEVLDSISNLIKKNKEELQKFEELIKARFVELFGDPNTNSKGWKQKRFDEICENLDSKRKPITASERESGIYPYYGASGIVDYVADYIFDEDILLISEDGANLVMRSTPIAFSVSGKVWVNNHAHVVRFNNMAMQKYIEVFFSMISVADQITGSAQPKLNQANLNAMMFPVPDQTTLEEFLQFINQLDKSKFKSILS